MSNKYLGPADRQLIAEKWAAYASVREIAALVARHNRHSRELDQVKHTAKITARGEKDRRTP